MRLPSHDEQQLTGGKAGQWIALALCVGVLAAGALEQLIHNRPTYAATFAPVWLPFVAALITAAGILRLNERQRWFRIRRVLCWTGLLLMVWTANGLPFDLLRLTPLMPPGIDWPGLATRMLALAATVVLARLLLTRQVAPASTRVATWYGYAAFVLALPYPVLRTCWAIGWTPGLMHPGAGGEGWLPWLACIPWILAAALSLLLVSKPRWISRRVLLAAGWTATAIVAMIGPAACWTLVTKLMTGEDLGSEGIGIATWVPCLFYGSWFLWAIAAGAATRSYQLRSVSYADVRADETGA